MEADAESRKCEIRTEWKLDTTEFRNIIQHFSFSQKIDLFASRINKQLEKFVAYRPDPDAIAIDAFTIDWKGQKFYAFPPFSCINRVVQKIIADQATGILIVPDWPNQYWYPDLFKLSVAEPLSISSRCSLHQLPNQPDQTHPIWENLPLLACLLSGKD